MGKLIKNELTKVLHKKSLYIILIITLGFMILGSVLTKVFDNTTSYDQYYYDMDQSTLDDIKSSLEEINKETDKDYYVGEKSYIEVIELGRKYEKGSWQRYIIDNQAQEIITQMIEAEDTEYYQEYKTKYENFVNRLETEDWRSFADEELKDINEQINLIEQYSQDSSQANMSDNLNYLKYKKQVLEWRLEKDISYGNSNLNTYLDAWLSSKQSIDNYESASKEEKEDYENKYSIQTYIETVAICEYAIENNIDEKLDNTGSYTLQYQLIENAKTELLSVIDGYSIFIIIAIIVIAGTIVSEEFNKGTIKLLLVKPYKRTKILLSKFITCLIVLALIVVIVILMQTIVGGITYGFDSYSTPTPIYNFNTNSLETIGLAKYLSIIVLSKIPMYILLMTLAFTLSVVFNNSPIAIALPILGFMFAETINQLAYYYEKAKFLMYFVTPNWDLSIYLFGRLPELESITMPFSILICIVYFVIMMAVSMLVFKKKDIKNI